MRSLLGIFLALNGTIIRGITAVATLFAGLNLVTSPEAWAKTSLTQIPVALLLVPTTLLAILIYYTTRILDRVP